MYVVHRHMWLTVPVYFESTFQIKHRIEVNTFCYALSILYTKRKLKRFFWTMGKKDKNKKKGKGAEKTAMKTDKKLAAKQKKLLEKIGEVRRLIRWKPILLMV